VFAFLTWPWRHRHRPQRRECPVCRKRVRAGERCDVTVCPWELDTDGAGRVILAGPLRQRIR
jgi:hypothetical protein